ncbi:hypothetical protein [Eleftheria terrae]|uniref:hypothetical protein n=1 Tax=Eleftheria terrae TaxID=1597781 RepID=UPI00263BD3D3|nr:hypothetical protein [Eleftheria terrae]WKB53524.1 hypothetical protein N7L95_03750 [Eleftheria terrae]
MSKTFRFWMTGCVAVVMAAVSAELAGAKSLRPLAAIESKYGTSETLRKIESAAEGRGYTVFARVAGRGPAGEALPSTALVLGSVDGVTPVLVDESGRSIDAPLSLLIVGLPDGRTEVRFFDASRYGQLAPGSDPALAEVARLRSVLDSALA